LRLHLNEAKINYFEIKKQVFFCDRPIILSNGGVLEPASNDPDTNLHQNDLILSACFLHDLLETRLILVKNTLDFLQNND